MEDTPDSLIEDIYPNVSPEFLMDYSPILAFKPWHKPRKQWLREHQWNAAISDLLKEIRVPEGNSPLLTYFSLPGEDLLDFRTISSFCAGKGIQVKLVGFNNPRHGDNADSVLRESFLLRQKTSVFGEKHVVSHSDVHLDNFTSIANADSVAYQFTEQKGPFDVINLDLCDSFSGSTRTESCYKATLNLLQLQVEKRTEPWLFLLTTRADKKKVNAEDFPNFWNNIMENVRASEDFANDLKNHLINVNADSVDDVSEFLGQLNSPKFEQLFGLFIGKWLLRIVSPGNRWEVRMPTSYSYRTNSAKDGEPNMLSLAFLFQPISPILIDPAGLANGASSQAHNIPTESSQAVELLRKTVALTDVDILLDKDKAVLNEYIEKASELLASLGYDVGQYREWALEHSPFVSKSTTVTS